MGSGLLPKLLLRLDRREVEQLEPRHISPVGDRLAVRPRVGDDVVGACTDGATPHQPEVLRRHVLHQEEQEDQEAQQGRGPRAG